MPKTLVLIDPDKTLVRETKNVSQYYMEGIRMVYGVYIDDINLDEFVGKTTQETVVELLKRNEIPDAEIQEKLHVFAEELPYEHYNVAGHDHATLGEGAKEAMEKLSKDNEIMLGAASGQLERILKNMFERAGVKMEDYIRFGAYGDAAFDMSGIITAAVEKANGFGIAKERMFFVGYSPQSITAAKSLGLRTIGIATDYFYTEQLTQAGAERVTKSARDIPKMVRS
ncbi:MAG TPA: HAD hydrolase-like protein [Candidatus Baltobacteraceae bacterium]|nr:HAD hydrolase-like protein [Candidatus Baltobacteraceae bacterium]